MLILGVDPGSIKAGYALIETQGRKFKYLESGVLFYPKGKHFLAKLGIIFDSCLELVEKYKPDEIALESLIFVKNVSSLAKLSQARGAMLAAFCHKNHDDIFEYSPTLIKSCVTGSGRSDKKSVEKSLKMIFGDISFKTDDESDALAIALTHALLLKKK